MKDTDTLGGRVGKLIFRVLCSLFSAVIVAMPASAQVYWDENSATPSVDLDQGVFSDETGDYTTTYTNSLFEGDVVFSSDAVTSASQTILLSGLYNPGQGYVMAGLIFDSAGAITLQDDSSHPGSALLIDYDGITMDPGAGAATISTPTLYVDGSQTWNNNSSSNLTIEGGIAQGNDEPYDLITLDGSGTGSVIFNDSINVELGIDQQSTTSVLYLNGTKNSNLVNLTIDGGIVSAASSAALGPAPVQLADGGTLIISTTGTFNHAINVSNGGTLDFTGDTQLNWGKNAVTADVLTFGKGDDLDTSTGTQSIGTLDLVGGAALSTQYRLILGASGQGLGLINGTVINVGANYIFDSASSGTITNTITFASGSALEIRSNAVDTYTNAILPTAGTFTVGSDDYNPGTINLAVPLVLTGILDLDVNSSASTGQGTKVTMSGNISGNGGLSITETGSWVSSPLYLSGTNTYTGGTTLTNPASGIGLPVVVINGNSSGMGDAFNIQAGTLVFDPAGSLSTAAVITLGGTTGTTAGYLEIGDSTGAANLTVGGLLALGNTGADAIYGGNASLSTLTVNVVSGSDTYSGDIGSGGTHGTELALVKTGAGTLTLANGNSYYMGGTTINQGVLAIEGGGNPGAGQSSVGRARLRSIMRQRWRSSTPATC